jgi:hypothetical protein
MARARFDSRSVRTANQRALHAAVFCIRRVLPKPGAGGGTRTHTGFLPTDFKSVASTIPPRPPEFPIALVGQDMP